LRRNVTQYGQKAIQALIWEKSGETKTFNITNNSLSSSILEPYLHIDHFGDAVKVRDRIELVTTSYTDLAKKYPYLLDKKYNFIVLDCQGAEYEVLLGIGKEHIQQFDLVEVEVSNSEEYKGQKQQPTIDKLLADWGFGPPSSTGAFHGIAWYHKLKT
jgi:FkbM family methyltransferase